MFVGGSFFNIENKFWEFQVERYSEWETYFNFQICFNRKCDHAGLRCNAEICGYWVDLQIYDCRHWDYDHDKWFEYTSEVDGD
jgi:hypothetical protein